MSGLSLRLDGMPAGGFCQQHGPYESTWERTWFSHAQGVLACICPTCAQENPKDATITIPDQSIPRILPRVRSVATKSCKLLWLKVPKIAVDALNLACLNTAGTLPLSQLRGNAFATAALSLSELSSEEMEEKLYGLSEHIPDRLILDKANLALSLAEDQDAPVRDVLTRRHQSRSQTAFEICLLAWFDTFDDED